MKTLKTISLIAITTTVLFSSLLLAGDGEKPPATSNPEWQLTPDLQVSMLQPGIWVHTSWMILDNGARVSSNGLIVREDDSLLLIDTAWGDDSTRALLVWIEQELGLPVTAVISTHAHADRMGGAPVMAEYQIPLYAHPSGFEMARTQGWPEPMSIGDLQPGESTSIGTVEVFYPGAAHTRDNLVVWLEEPRVLVGGCAVKSIQSQTMGYIGEADMAEWPESIRRISDTYPEAQLVLPGHGAIGGQELLLHTNRLIEESE